MVKDTAGSGAPKQPDRDVRLALQHVNVAEEAANLLVALHYCMVPALV